MTSAFIVEFAELLDEMVSASEADKQAASE